MAQQADAVGSPGAVVPGRAEHCSGSCLLLTRLDSPLCFSRFFSFCRGVCFLLGFPRDFQTVWFPELIPKLVTLGQVCPEGRGDFSDVQPPASAELKAGTLDCRREGVLCVVLQHLLAVL